jgi:hypothetical protein
LAQLINRCASPLPFIQLPPQSSSLLIDTVNMATTAMDYEAANGDRYEEDEAPRYERDNRSASPRPVRDDNDGGRRRSVSPGGNADG